MQNPWKTLGWMAVTAVCVAIPPIVIVPALISQANARAKAQREREAQEMAAALRSFTGGKPGA